MQILQTMTSRYLAFFLQIYYERLVHDPYIHILYTAASLKVNFFVTC